LSGYGPVRHSAVAPLAAAPEDEAQEA